MSAPYLSDCEADFPTQSQQLLQGPVVSVTVDRVEFDGEVLERQVVRHPGAVGVVALREAAGETEILLVRQYRHPVRRFLWEIPAGLRDQAGEPAEECARRELLEETGHRAGAMTPLTTVATSPGGSDELITLFLTMAPEPDTSFSGTGEAEERLMEAAWFPLSEALAAVAEGRMLNAIAQLGVCLAALRVRLQG